MALVTFLVMHATPGSPLDPVAEGANPLSPEAQKNLAEAYGLDKPLWEQFGIFIGKSLRGDFGQSFVYKTRTVSEILVETFPISLFLGAMALAIAVAGGVTLGILAAVYPNRSWDYVCVSLATLGVSLPNFLLAVFLTVLFPFVIPLFPTRAWGPHRRGARGGAVHADLEPLAGCLASPPPQQARGRGWRDGDPALPRGDLRGLPCTLLVYEGEFRQDLRVSLPRVPARHRSAGSRRALAHDLRGTGVHARGRGRPGHHRDDRRAHRPRRGLARAAPRPSPAALHRPQGRVSQAAPW